MQHLKKSMKATFLSMLIAAACAATGCQPAPVQNATETITVPASSAFKFVSEPSETTENAMNLALPVADHFIQAEYDTGYILAIVTPNAVSVKALGSLSNLQDPAHARLPIGSLTKVFVGMQLASMVQDGTVTLDTPLTKCIPDGLDTTGVDDITLQMLTTHTSGLPRLQPELLDKTKVNIADPYTNVSADAVWNALSTAPRKGTGAIQYSNFGEAVLGLALTRCAQAESWESLLSSRVTNVLGLNSVRIDSDENEPIGHDIMLNPQRPWTWNETGMAPAGALKADILDLSKLLQMSMTTSQFDGKEILTKSQEILVTDDTPNAAIPAIAMNWIHGIGPASNGLQKESTKEAMKELVWHNGQTNTFESFMGYIPQQNIGIVVLSDSASGNATNVGLLSLALTLGDSPEITQADLNKHFPPAFEQSADKLHALEGDYFLEPINLTLHLALDEKGHLIDQTNHLRLYPVSENVVRYRVINATISFEFNDDGTPKSATFTQNGESVPMKKVN